MELRRMKTSNILLIILGILILLNLLGGWLTVKDSRNKELNYEKCIGNIEKWDYTTYGYGGRNNECPQRKLYGNSYCDVFCDDNISFQIKIGIDNLNQAIPAQRYILERNESHDCNFDCYGEFRGYTCDVRSVVG